MRHDIPFPIHNDYEICHYLKNIWECGWLDEYSDEHFLIKAIENRLTTFVGYTQMLNNEPNLHGVIKAKGIIDNDTFNSNFCMNLSGRLACLESLFGSDHMERFIKDQLSAGKQNYNEDTFFEAVSEVSVLYFYTFRSRWKQALYEPPIGKSKLSKNPEARFIGELSLNGDAQKITINIEVKCPKFPSIENQECKIAIPTVLLSDEGRKEIPAFCKDNGIVYISPRVMKLKDFLNSASSKFSVPQNNEYNLLYINWSYCDFASNSFLEAWSLLTNAINGILTHPNAAQSIGVSPDVFKKITAVIIYTEALEGLMFLDFRNVWQMNGRGQRFRMWVLDEKLRHAETTRESDTLFYVTGMKPNALRYTPEGGSIHVALNEQEDRIIISVDNDGIQIPEDDLLRLWEPFYRVDKAHNRSDGGSGLGLAIVHAAVLAHGGICEVKNRPGGVCFRVILPQVSNK